MRFTSSGCQQHPASLARNSTFAVCSLWAGNARYVEYSLARNSGGGVGGGEEHPAQIKPTNPRSEAAARGSALRLCVMVDGFLAGPTPDSFSLLLLPKTLRPTVLIKSPRCDFTHPPPSPRSVAPLSIISDSRQTLLLIKEVNLWVACSLPPPPPPLAVHLPQQGAETRIWSCISKQGSVETWSF